MTDDNDNDDVGYGRPPRHSRFEPGQSGNPKGRPKGSRNLKTEFESVLNERVSLREGDKAKRVTKSRGILEVLVAKALKGDTKAMALVLDHIAKLRINNDGQQATTEQMLAEDQAILDAFSNQPQAGSDGPEGQAVDDGTERSPPATDEDSIDSPDETEEEN